MKKKNFSLEVEEIKWTAQYDHIIKWTIIEDDVLQITVYSCKKKRVLYRLFANQKEYITYKFNTQKWSKAMLRNLVTRDWHKISKYKVEPCLEKHTYQRILGNKEDDILKAIYAYQKQLKMNEYHKLRSKIDNMFDQLKPLPDNLNEWVIDKVFKDSNYMIYQKKGSRIFGHCTRCKKDTILKKVKHNKRVICPECQTDVTALSKGLWMRIHDVSDTKYFNVINNTSNGLVIRVFCATKDETYKKQSFKTRETSRFLLRERQLPIGYRKCDKTFRSGYHYWSYGCDWHERKDSVYDESSYLYTDNLDKELNSRYQYCGIKKYAEGVGTIDVMRYLYNYQSKPLLEQLAKGKFFALITDIILYQSYYGLFQSLDMGIDFKASTLQQALGLNKDQVKVIQRANVDINLIKLYKYSISLGQELNANELIYLQEKQGSDYFYSPYYPYEQVEELTQQPDVISNRKHAYVTLKKLIMYKQKQEALGHGRNFYNNYLDYLKECKILQYNLRSKTRLYPKDLLEAHQKTSALISIKKDEKINKKIIQLNNSLAPIYEEEYQGYCFIMPKGIDDFFKESDQLKHCVKNYAERMANETTTIVFMRKKGEENKPLYTIEYKKRRIQQIQGFQHSTPPEGIKKIADVWAKNIEKKLLVT
ncbi:PcfJ domain-containing protein (plasmid) [Vallitalea pronyensis]|uniref:PcfJ domain-containing protein n=1 Tax=Vallitalea pronyensis TaxID=1348613 RepID=A0A8J8MQZ8_9FIRM|nr:PcfJ domain-containing protein [Vallitalea pronyensis]QUI25883.1 PcfJ domain-containing protein [Vallitalea pronyensis]